MELFKASNQWMTRPPDERFWTVADMTDACRAYAGSAVKAKANLLDCAAGITQDGELKLLGPTGAEAKFTHHSFGQVCSRATANAKFMRRLSPQLARDNLNYCLSQYVPDSEYHLMFHKNNGDLLLRSCVSEIYERIWNWEVGQMLQTLPSCWRTPPARPAMEDPRARPATQDDLLHNMGGGWLSVNVGDMIAPAGVYASDHDMFAFLVNPDRDIDLGDGKTLCRGFFIWNSEVGGISLGLTTFWFDAVCGNHIVWGAQNVRDVRIRHVGKAREKMSDKITAALIAYSDVSASDDEAKVKSAMNLELGKTKEEVLDAVGKIATGNRLQTLTKRRAELAYKTAEETPRYGNPRSLWGMVSGLTENATKEQFMDTRVAVERDVGKLMDVAF